MTVAFVRQLGAESGVQLNPLRDNSEIPTQDNWDQMTGIMCRLTRGRIDKPFKVDRGNVFNKIGNGEQIRVSALNEAWVHIVEAVNNGTYEFVVQRLVTSSAAISYAIATIGSGAVLDATLAAGVVTSIAASTPGTGYTVGQELSIVGVGTGAAATVASVNATGGILTLTVSAGGTGYVTPVVTVKEPISFYVSAELPTVPYLFAVKHLECFNDGIKLEFRAEEKRAGGVNVANDVITLVLRDIDGKALYEFTGSLSSTALDDYQNSYYLTDIVSARTDAVEVSVGLQGSIPTTSSAYGYNAITGLPNSAKSATLICFTEGGSAYSTQDYMAARQKLQYTPHNYAYISSGGTQSVGMLAQLAQLAFDTNRQLKFDVPGGLSTDAAITFVEQLNMGASLTAQLMHQYWVRFKSDDPTGINGKGYYGAATLNCAYSNGRNAQTDAKGFAPKNFPIAGRQWPVRRTGLVHDPRLTDQELNAVARAKINPVMSETYTGGSRTVFRDFLTAAQVESSLIKLTSVSDMAATIDDAVTRFGKDILMLPMELAVKRTEAYLKALFEGAQAAKWIVPSSDPEMGGMAFRYVVKPNDLRPYDRLDINYWLRYDGAVRQIFVTQTLTR
ncbi:MAG: hypothetical protein M0Q44_01355 [Methylobacter sp.]|jgi:hypothetical protein|nr:hypothetical protein [Methylobacter sp.]